MSIISQFRTVVSILLQYFPQTASRNDWIVEIFRAQNIWLENKGSTHLFKAPTGESKIARRLVLWTFSQYSNRKKKKEKNRFGEVINNAKSRLISYRVVYVAKFRQTFAQSAVSAYVDRWRRTVRLCRSFRNIFRPLACWTACCYKTHSGDGCVYREF